MHACVRSAKQKYAPIHIYIWMKTFVKTGVYIYIYNNNNNNNNNT